MLIGLVLLIGSYAIIRYCITLTWWLYKAATLETEMPNFPRDPGQWSRFDYLLASSALIGLGVLLLGAFI